MTLAITVNPRKPEEQRAYEEARPAPPTLATARLGAEDVATLVINGREHTEWLAISVTNTFRVTPHVYTASLAEPAGKVSSWATLPVKPGDRATMYLAGHKVVDGYVVRRSTRLNANAHELVVEGASRDIDLTATSAKPRQYRGYTLSSVAKGSIKDAGVPGDFLTRNLPRGADAPIQNFNVADGETVWQAIERACRKQGVFLWSDRDGNLVGGMMDGKAAAVATRAEGVNILEISATLDDQSVMHKVMGLAQDQGSDERFGKMVAEVAAVAESPGVRPWRVRRVNAETTSNPAELQRRVDFQNADSIYTAIDVQIVVHGWRRPDGKLWDIAHSVEVESPSCFPENGGRMKLAIRSVTFQQSNAGTTTLLALCLPRALGGLPDPGVKGAVPNLLDPQPGDARPAPEAEG